MPNSTKRKDGDWAAPILVAAVVSILGVVLVGLMLVLFLAAMGTGIAAVGIVALIYGLAGIALIVGIIAAAARRIQELERGEEEDAKRY